MGPLQYAHLFDSLEAVCLPTFCLFTWVWVRNEALTAGDGKEFV